MMKTRLKDFPIDHKLMAVGDTPKMKAILEQIMALHDEYNALKEIEQRREWNAYLSIVRSNARASYFR